MGRLKPPLFKIMKDQATQPLVDLWIEKHVYDLIKGHSDKFPYYHANITVVENDEKNKHVRVQIKIDGKGRNEIQQNLCLLLINSLKGKKP